LVSLLPGIFFGWLLARGRFRGKGILDAVIHLPLVLPPVVVGYLLLILLGRRGALGQWLHNVWGIDVLFTWRALVIASAVMGFPLLVRSVRLAIEGVDRRLEEVSLTLGKGRWVTFVSVTLPLALPGLLAGMILSFARSLGEFGASITIAGNIDKVTRTVPLAVFSHSQQPGGDAQAMRLVVFSVAIAMAAMLVSESLARRARRLVEPA
jgi:molybdate transport system permease protein